VFQSGQHTRLGLQADRETREFTVDVQTLELPKNWAIGQRAEVYIEIEKKEDAILVPMEYIITIELGRDAESPDG